MDRTFTHSSTLLPPLLTVPSQFLIEGLSEYAKIHSQHKEYADVITVTVIVAFVSHFFIQDVGVSVFLDCFC
jgi:hypothetical protein